MEMLLNSRMSQSWKQHKGLPPAHSGGFSPGLAVVPRAGCGVEFTVLLPFLVSAYREQVTDTLGYGLVN